MRILVGFLSLCLSSVASAWWNDDWSQRMEITIDTAASGLDLREPLPDVPVLIRLHAGNFPQFFNVRENGADLRFIAADDITPLRFHIERFDPIVEMAYVWVRLPQVQAGAQSLYLYFDNPAAPAASDPGASFDVSTVAAFHFAETSGLPLDSTAYGTRVLSGQLLPNPASLIGTGATLTGMEAMVIDAAPQLAADPSDGWTFATWLRVNDMPAEPAWLLDRRDDSGGRLGILLDAEGIASVVGNELARASSVFQPGRWHHVALVVRADGTTLYLDGNQVAVQALTPGPMTGRVFIGGSRDGNGLLVADLDELHISNVARTPAWIAFSSAIQGPEAERLVSYGLDQAAAVARAQGHFGIIIQNVFGKPEAWVEQAVIILCIFMMIGAAAIMYFKSVLLARASGATRQFLAAFRGLGQKRGEDDLDALYGARRQFGDSPLWRVYHVGIDEVRKRMLPAAGADFSGIDEKSMNAVRAAMDATMVREGQRLNSQLVLLTIAISGGPFIGLFGTTVGVMVTFAAIAATGDVNIATIAPGMAAALLATVAGLGVAIPALFGYNYLTSRVKDQLADMRVFADELTARFNELYGT